MLNKLKEYLYALKLFLVASLVVCVYFFTMIVLIDSQGHHVKDKTAEYQAALRANK